jgi:hypothetical protein
LFGVIPWVKNEIFRSSSLIEAFRSSELLKFIVGLISKCKTMRTICFLFTLVLLTACISRDKNAANKDWIQLFNGKDLQGWDLKISGHPLNENYKNIFGVENGILKVSYAGLDSFRGEFGHLFYKQKFSKYILRIEYRFVGEQCPGGASWAMRNSGAMLHSQSAASMGLKQDFPVSIEAQLLGGLGAGERPTANVCTPGTDIDIDGKQVASHCTNSHSKTYDGDQWVQVEMIVLGDSIIHHIIGTDTVISYTHPRIGPEMKDPGFTVADGTPLTEGYIALQAESSGVEFRKVELLDLSDR